MAVMSVKQIGLERHRFAELDNAAIEVALKTPLARLFDLSAQTPWWITQTLYADFPLREQETRWVFHLDAEENFKLLDQKANGEPVWLERNGSVRLIEPVANDWLSCRNHELFEHCEAFNLSLTEGMRVSVRKEHVTYDRSFGLY